MCCVYVCREKLVSMVWLIIESLLFLFMCREKLVSMVWLEERETEVPQESLETVVLQDRPEVQEDLVSKDPKDSVGLL